MKNYLVITLGTREIQLLKSAIEPNGFEVITEIRKETPFTYVQPVNRPELRLSARSNEEFSDYFTISPRLDGKKIMGEHWTLFRPIIDFPLIRPALDHLKRKPVAIDIIMLVYTNQEEAFEEGRVKKRSYINGDTVYFAEIIEKLIREDSYFSSTYIDLFGRFDAVADMAVQYEEFKKIKDDLLSNEPVDNVYLFPQGGIDQINQALTMRLIETFEGRVTYLQNAEGKEIQELDFPGRFVNTLASKAILKHLEDMDFDAITDNMHTNSALYVKASYAAKRLNLQYESLADSFTEAEKVVDLYLAMKIRFRKQRKYNEFLWRAHTLNEVLFKLPVEQVMGPVNRYYKSALGKLDRNDMWEDALNNVDPGLIPYLVKKKITINNPNRWAYKSIYIFLCNKGVYADPNMPIRKQVGDKLELLATSRNASQHGLGSITADKINNILSGKSQDYSTEILFTQLDRIFNISGFGIYDTIRDEIRELL